MTRQGICLLSEVESEYMSVFDKFTPSARKLLANSKYNICAACYYDYLGKIRNEKETLELLERAIESEDPSRTIDEYMSYKIGEKDGKKDP